MGAPVSLRKRSPRNLALHTAHTMRVPETPPFAPYHGWLRRGSRFATAIERPQGPDTLSFVSLSPELQAPPAPRRGALVCTDRPGQLALPQRKRRDLRLAVIGWLRPIILGHVFACLLWIVVSSVGMGDAFFHAFVPAAKGAYRELMKRGSPACSPSSKPRSWDRR